MKNYRLYEAQDNAMNYIILTDGEGLAKHIDHDVSEDEITELAKLLAEQDSELESRVEGDWMSEGKAFDGLFAKREIEEAHTPKTYYSVELESNSYMDDIINGTLEECRE